MKLSVNGAITKAKSVTIGSWNRVLLTRVDLENVHRLALSEARKSPCKRRKYGTVIFTVFKVGVEIGAIASNERVSKCCDYECIRETLNIEPFQNGEIGAEIHAEQAALILNGKAKPRQQIFLAGVYANGKEIYNPKPCYSCLRMLKYTGFKSVHYWDGYEYQVKSVAEYMEEYDFIHAPDA